MDKKPQGVFIAILLVVMTLIIVAIWKIPSNYPQIKFDIVQSVLTIITLVVGGGWSIYKIYRKNKIYLSFAKYFDDAKEFVNRKQEIKDTIALIKGDEIINIYGAKGTGKSETLKMISDFINGYHKKAVKDKYEIQDTLKQLKYNCYYFDVSDNGSIQEIIRQVCSVFTTEKIETPEKWASFFNKSASTKCLFILDNINNLSAGKTLVGQLLSYLTYRKDDRFIIGSVEKVFDISMHVHHYEILPLTKGSISEYIQMKKIEGDLDLDLLERQTCGLPLYLNLVFSNKTKKDYYNFESISSFISNRIIKNLSADNLLLLNYIAYLNLSSTVVDIEKLVDLPISHIYEKIEQLKIYSTLIDVPSTKGRSIKIHDLLRDFLIYSSSDQREEINDFLYNYFQSSQYHHKAIIHWLLSGGALEFNIEVYNFIKGEISNSNFIYLESIWNIILINKHLVKNNVKLYRLILFGYIKSLLGFGDYISAEKLVNSSNYGKVSLPNIRKLDSEFEFDFHYSLVDIDHLLNRYHAALDVLYILSNIAESNFPNKIADCEWLIGHLLGHLGDSKDESISHYSKSIYHVNKTNIMLKYKSFSGIVAWEISYGTFNLETINNIDKNISEISELKGSAATISSLYRLKARIFRKLEKYDDALLTILKSKEIAVNNRLRTNADCLIVLGDIYRSMGEFESAIDYYASAYEFGEYNSDLHLKCTAEFGIILTELSAGKLMDHESWAVVHNQVIQYIDYTDSKKMYLLKYHCQIIELYLHKHCLDSSDELIRFKSDAIKGFLNLTYENKMVESMSLSLLNYFEMYSH